MKHKRAGARSGLGNTVLSHLTMSQVSHWIFTWHDTEKIPTWNAERMRYLVYQLERAPDTGKLHFQGYVEFKRSTKMGGVKKALGSDTVHLEPRQGTRDQARGYCMKEESRVDGPFEFGQYVESEQGKRSDLDTVADDIKAKMKFQDIIMRNLNAGIRYFNGIERAWRIYNEKARDPNERVYNYIIHGDAGVGKSRFAYYKWPEAYNAYMPGWWQGYTGQEAAIYDDFDGRAHMDISWFKRVCDRYPLMLPMKGGSAQYVAKVNVFTSNTYPIEWYPREHWEAVKRRMDHIIWWRVDSIRCETCQDDCEFVNEINEWLSSL